MHLIWRLKEEFGRQSVDPSCCQVGLSNFSITNTFIGIHWVPQNQMSMLLKEGSAYQYVYDSINSTIESYKLSDDNYFFALLLNKKYTPSCCPTYLTRDGFETLKKSGVQRVKIHTETYKEVLQRKTYNKVILMDHIDWFGNKEAKEEIELIYRQLEKGGLVMWRSAGRHPWYNSLFEEAGFQVEPAAIREPGSGKALDRVNMYASCWIARKN